MNTKIHSTKSKPVASTVCIKLKGTATKMARWSGGLSYSSSLAQKKKKVTVVVTAFAHEYNCTSPSDTVIIVSGGLLYQPPTPCNSVITRTIIWE